MNRSPRWSRTLIALLGLGIGAMPAGAAAHPMGNFSISHYAGITIHPRRVELRYLIDMAEIPTFQELQDSAIVPEDGHPSLDGYLARKADVLKEALVLELNGRRLMLQKESSSILFSPGAGELPTMKLGIVYVASLADALSAGLNRLVYRDENFPDRAGWKEVGTPVRSARRMTIRSPSSRTGRRHAETPSPTSSARSRPAPASSSSPRSWRQPSAPSMRSSRATARRSWPPISWDRAGPRAMRCCSASS